MINLSLHTYVRNVAVIVVENRDGDPISNTGQDFLHLTSRKYPVERQESNYSVSSYE